MYIKRMRRASALSLIALALLLTAASPAPNTVPSSTPSPRPAETASHQIQKHDDNRERQQGNTATTVASIAQLEPTPSQPKTTDADEQVQREIAKFTLLLVFVGLLQVVAAFLQWRASQKSAAAALESARAADLALRANRPLVIVSEVTMRVADNSLTPHVTFRNYGHGPAILLEVYLGLATKTKAEIQQLRQEHLGEYQRHSIQTQVLGEDEPLTDVITVKWVRLADVLEGKQTEVAHGLIRYRDVLGFPEPYESRFCWFYLPPDALQPNGSFIIGPKELNTTT